MPDATGRLRTAAANSRLPALLAQRRLSQVGGGGGWFELDPEVEARVVSRTHPRKAFENADVVVATAWTTADLVHDVTADGAGRGLYLIQHYEDWYPGATQLAVDATWRLPLHKVVIARWLQDHATTLGQVDNVTYIPNGIDLEHLTVETAPHDRDPRHVAMMISPLPWKGHAVGLEALRLASEEIGPLRVSLFGGGVSGESIPEEHQRFGSIDQHQVRRLLNDAAIFLHTSDAEGWPLPPAEAMACGAALIATDNPGVLDYLEPSLTARVVPRRDAAAMAAAIIELVTDPEERAHQAVRARRSIEAYTWLRAVDAFECLLESP